MVDTNTGLSYKSSHPIHGNMSLPNNHSHIEVRRVQALTGERSLTLVLPKVFAIELGIGKGTFLKCHIADNRLIIEKTDL